MMKMVFPHARVSRSFGELASDMNTLVDSLFSAASGNGADTGSFTPRMDIHELSDRFVVAIDVPGVKPEAIDIDVKDDDLVIQGSRSSAVESKDDGFYRIERWAGEFRRTIKLPRTVDREHIEAACNDGVLTLTLPKSKANQARKINVRTGGETSGDVANTTVLSHEVSQASDNGHGEQAPAE